MVLAYHLIISAYGFWLPNDPRGSWSDCIRKWELLRYGPATKVRSNEFVARVPHDRALREAAKEALAYPPVCFTDEQIQIIGRGFANYVEKSGVTFWAVSILDDHLHAVFLRHRYKSEQVANLLKGELTKATRGRGTTSLRRDRKAGRGPAAVLRSEVVDRVHRQRGPPAAGDPVRRAEPGEGGEAAADLGFRGPVPVDACRMAEWSTANTHPRLGSSRWDDR